MIQKFKVPLVQKKDKPKVSYGISKIDGIRSTRLGVTTPKGGSYGINKNPFSTTYSASGTTGKNVSISASVTKPTYGKRESIKYGLQILKKF